MIRCALLVTVALGLAGLNSQQAGLSSNEIAAAIDQGRRVKEPMHVVVGEFARGVGGVYLRGPFSRIVTVAADAARKYRPFSVQDVTPEMAAPLLEVIVPAPEPSGTTWSRGEDIEHVVVRSPGAKDVFQPSKVDRFTRTWGNAMGGQMDTAGLVAWFDMKTLPDGDLELVLIRASRERIVRVKASDRVHIR